jgi:hypothetical protein
MNIVQFHERVRFWADVVSSTRFESEDIDNGINIAVDNKWRESYDQNRVMNRSDSFQRVQRIRDELGNLVKLGTKDSEGITLADNVIESLPDNYGYLLSLEALFDGFGYQPVFPISHNQKSVVSKNPFRRVRTSPSSKCYYYEEDGGIVIQHGYQVDVSNIKLYYLARPGIVNYGIEYDSSHSFSNGDKVIAVEETVYNGVTYRIGDEILIVNPNLTITSGLVVFNFNDCDIRDTAHEEISRRGAINCLITANQGDKANALRQEIMAL